MAYFHITNGDSTARLIEESGISGPVLPWRDPMHHGPFPANATLRELRKIRAEYFSGSGLTLEDVERDFVERDRRLETLRDDDHIVLWFEHDLLDQLQLLQILDQLAPIRRDGSGLSIICINAFHGITPFRGLGQLTSQQLASLFDKQEPVTPAMLDLTRTGWTAFRSDDPRDLIHFLKGDISALPFLKDALTRHLEEYPNTHTGLTRTETQLLSLVANGVATPQELFQHNMDFETALFIGDWHTFSVLGRLMKAGLLRGEIEHFEATPQEDHAAFRNQTLHLTEKGEKALAGGLEPNDVINRNQWLGGVHIKSGKGYWTWDTESANLVWLP